MPNHLESNTRVFVIRIWLEEDTGGEEKAIWRGSIVHVSPDEKNKREHYISDLFEIDLYILSHLLKIGIRASWFWRILNWYKLGKWT